MKSGKGLTKQARSLIVGGKDQKHIIGGTEKPLAPDFYFRK